MKMVFDESGILMKVDFDENFFFDESGFDELVLYPMKHLMAQHVLPKCCCSRNATHSSFLAFSMAKSGLW